MSTSGGPPSARTRTAVVDQLQTAASTVEGALPAATMVGVVADALRLAADEG